MCQHYASTQLIHRGPSHPVKCYSGQVCEGVSRWAWHLNLWTEQSRSPSQCGGSPNLSRAWRRQNVQQSRMCSLCLTVGAGTPGFSCLWTGIDSSSLPRSPAWRTVGFLSLYNSMGQLLVVNLLQGSPVVVLLWRTLIQESFNINIWKKQDSDSILLKHPRRSWDEKTNIDSS